MGCNCGGRRVTVYVARAADGRRKRFLHRADAEEWAAARNGTVETVTA